MPSGLLGQALSGTQSNLAVTGTAGALTVPAGAQAALIQNIGTVAITLAEDGTTATATNTYVIQPGDAFVSYTPSKVSLIRATSTSGAVSAGYYLLLSA